MADIERSLRVRGTVRFPWRVRAILGALVACYLFVGVVLLVGAGAWNPSPTLDMVERVSPFRTWGCGALFIAACGLWALVRQDSFVCRLALVGSAGFTCAWAAAFVASWVAGESQSPLGIGFCGIIALWSIVLSGVPFTDPVREAAYGMVRTVEAANAGSLSRESP